MNFFSACGTLPPDLLPEFPLYQCLVKRGFFPSALGLLSLGVQSWKTGLLCCVSEEALFKDAYHSWSGRTLYCVLGARCNLLWLASADFVWDWKWDSKRGWLCSASETEFAAWSRNTFLGQNNLYAMLRQISQIVSWHEKWKASSKPGSKDVFIPCLCFLASAWIQRNIFFLPAGMQRGKWEMGLC